MNIPTYTKNIHYIQVEQVLTSKKKDNLKQAGRYCRKKMQHRVEKKVCVCVVRMCVYI